MGLVSHKYCEGPCGSVLFRDQYRVSHFSTSRAREHSDKLNCALGPIAENRKRMQRVKMMFLVKLIRFVLAAVNVMLASLLSDALGFQVFAMKK